MQVAEHPGAGREEMAGSLRARRATLGRQSTLSLILFGPESRKSVTAFSTLGILAPRFNWRAEFSNRDMEARFRQSEVKPGLERGMLVLCLLSILAATALAIADVVDTGGSDNRPLVLSMDIAALTFLLVTYTAASRTRAVDLRITEVLFTLAFIANSVAVALIFSESRLRILLGEQPFDREKTDGRHTDLKIYISLQVLLSVTAMFIPLQPVLYVLCALSTAACLIVTDALLPMSSGGDGTKTRIVSSVVLANAMVCIRIRIALIERRQYYLFLSAEVVALKRKSAEAESEARANETEAVLAEKQTRSRLIRMVMHDIRSPLLSISNLVTTLLDEHRYTKIGDPSVGEHLRSIESCSSLMQNIVSDMLDFDRIDSGRLTLVKEPFHTRDLLQSARATFHGLALKRGIALAIEEVPSELDRILPVGDLRRLQQCLNNGLSNAVKFTGEGGRITVRTWLTPGHSAEQKRSTVHVAVIDTGIGLDEEEATTLGSGDIFQQVGAGKLQGNNASGLGLGITRQLLQMHNSSELVISSPGHGCGCTFEMRLHLDFETVTKDTESSGSRSLRSTSGRRRARVATTTKAILDDAAAFPESMCILIAEDNRVLRKSIEMAVFRKLGVRHEQAENGVQALDLIVEKKRQYDIVVMDNQMPEMSGGQAIKGLRKAGFTGMIVGLTGDPPGCKERTEFEESGLDHCFDKDRDGMENLKELIKRYALPRTAHRAMSLQKSGAANSAPLTQSYYQSVGPLHPGGREVPH